MVRTRRTALAGLIAAPAYFALTGAVTKAAPAQEGRKPSVERGAYLVKIMGCNHCHTPYKLGPNGPEPDMSRALSGHPADFVMPAPPALDGKWNWLGAATNTAFSGPWGTSFTANLTPDPETGLGKWSVETFVAAMKTGRHEGKGRPILPPMPVENLAALSDDDIRDLFAYLRSLPPVRNRVPAPIDPAEAEK
jgi:cytochrome c553